MESDIMQNDLVEFLIKAKKKTYAGKGAETITSRPNSHDLMFEENELKYIDTYLGGKLFTGEEAMWQNDIPFWAMNYSGRVIGDNFNGDFLKLALFNVPKENPYRGPECFEDGEYTYSCKVNGEPEWFQGYEEIQVHGEKIYECYFHGGIVE
jgi:hypothetical protein